MVDAVDGEWTSLREAVAQGIAEGRALARATSDAFLAAADALRMTSPSDLLAGSAELTPPPADLVLQAERALLADLTGELKELAQRQPGPLIEFSGPLSGRRRTRMNQTPVANVPWRDDGTTTPPPAPQLCPRSSQHNVRSAYRMRS